jgi:predicted DNA binding CopG/RHH family protein
MKVEITIPDEALKAVVDTAHAQGMPLPVFIAVSIINATVPIDDRERMVQLAIEEWKR